MKALITGANGFLGSWLTRRLAQRGDSVRCLVRRNADTWGLDDLPIERVEGDIGDVGSLERALAGIDVVFHLAGIRRSPDRDLFFKVNAEGTRHVCEAMV